MLPWFDNDRFPLYLAPMAGFTDVVFRQLCKEQGADVMVTEFVSAHRFLDARGEAEAWEAVDFSEGQRPMGVQIFGGEPDKMAEAARRIVDRLHPDFIDINYGCPAPKVVDNCAGSSLLTDLPKLRAVAKGVYRAVGSDVPVTAKIRIGWDEETINAVEVGCILEDAGMQALAIHGRTKMQGYRGDANWEVINTVAEKLSIPVIGNGSVQTAEDVNRIKNESSVRGLMIGRAALGYPWIFRDIKQCLETGIMPPVPNWDERWELMLRYAEGLLSRPTRGNRWNKLNWMRPRLKAFAKDISGSKVLRQRLETVSDLDELKDIAEGHRHERMNESSSLDK